MKRMSRAQRRTQLKNAKAAPQAGMRRARGGMHKTAGKARMTRGQADVLAGRMQPYAQNARKAATHRASEAWDWAEPRFEQAAETVQDTIQRDVSPRVSSAITTAAERSAPAREEAMERGTAALAALKGEAPGKQRRRWPVALLLFVVGTGLGALGGIFGQRMVPANTVSAHGSRPGGPVTESESREESTVGEAQSSPRQSRM